MVMHLFDRGDVDDEAIADVAFEHTGIGGGDILDIDDLYVGNDIVLFTEVQHFLGFGEAADA